MSCASSDLRWQLIVPAAMRSKRPRLHGEHLAYHGAIGHIVAPAGNGGVWMRFAGMQPNEYIGCPVAWLQVPSNLPT